MVVLEEKIYGRGGVPVGTIERDLSEIIRSWQVDGLCWLKV